jgi:hypothetical protein
MTHPQVVKSVACLTVLAVSVGALWILEAEPAEAGAGPEARSGPSEVHELPPVPVSSSQEEAPPAIPLPEPGEVHALATQEERLVPMRFTGRVADLSGQAIVGARVAVLEDPRLPGVVAAIEAHEGDLEAWGQLTDPESLPFQLTDGDGRFDLDALLTKPDRKYVKSLESSGELYTPEPMLLVWDGDHAPALQSCEWLDGAAHDAGEIRLPPGGSVSGRCVGAQGEPLQGVVVAMDLYAERWDCPSDPSGGGPNFICGTGYVYDPKTIDVEIDDRLNMVTTDAEGRFVLTGLPEGTSRVWARAPGWLAWRSEWVELAAGDRVDLGPLVLERGGRVAGHVVDEGGRPIPGVTVRATTRSLDEGLALHERWIQLGKGVTGGGIQSDERLARESAELVSTTDESGRFEILGIDGSQIDVYADGSGHEPACVLDQSVGSEGVALRLSPSRTAEIRLTDGEGGVVVAERLLVSRTGRATRADGISSWEARGLAPAEGLWAVDDLCEHPVTFTVDLGGKIRPSMEVAEPLSLALEAGVAELAVPLWRRITGQLLDGDGEPLTSDSLQLHAVMPDGKRHGVARPAKDGLFDGQIPQDVHALQIRKAGFLDTDLPIPTRGDVDLGTVQVPAAPRIGVRVLDHQGHPLAGISVQMKEESVSPRWFPGRGSKTDEAGWTELPWQTAGSFEVRAASKDPRFSATTAFLEGEPRPVTLEFEQLPLATLSGTVLSGGQPVAGARVMARSAGKALAVSADAAGRFAIDLRPGELASFWAGLPEGGLTAWRDVELAPGEQLDLTVSLGAAVLSGSVRGLAAITELGGGLVLRRDGYEIIPIPVSSQGTFEVPGLDAGSWRLEASVGGRWHGDRRTLASLEVALPGPPVWFDVPAPAQLEVTLWERPGCLALLDYVVHIEEEGPGAAGLLAPGTSMGPSFHTGKTLPPGGYRLLVTPRLERDVEDISPYVLAERRVHLQPGEPRRVEILLDR